MREAVCSNKTRGFSLIELLISLAILTFGLLALGPLLYIAASSGSLARSKGTAAIAAQNQLEFLADLYRRNPAANELTLGIHQPQQAQLANPVDGTILNQYDIDWTVSTVSDPRPGKVLHARLVRVAVTPTRSGGMINTKPSLNKALNVTTIFGPGMP
jgi:prepilin-type N-terminal cleavage/methylation domain-containing protein